MKVILAQTGRQDGLPPTRLLYYVHCLTHQRQPEALYLHSPPGILCLYGWAFGGLVKLHLKLAAIHRNDFLLIVFVL